MLPVSLIQKVSLLKVHDTFNRSFASIVQRTSHHPSLFGYVLSNEIGFGGSSQFAELYHFANQHDPERPCWFGDGSTGVSGMNLTTLGCRDGQNAKDEGCFMDVWVPQSGWSHTAVKGFDRRFEPDISSGVDATELPVPMLLHEAMDARTFPRLQSNLESFQGPSAMLKAGMWYNSSIERMRALGLLEENDRWALASEKAYGMFQKAFLENYRLDPAVSGYEWCESRVRVSLCCACDAPLYCLHRQLTRQACASAGLGFDWIAASNGVIAGHANNPRAKPGISNTTLRNVQADVILLVKDPVALQSTGRRAGELVPFEIQLANWTFQGSPSWFGKSAELSWAASVVRGPPLNNGTSSLDTVSVAQGETGPVAVFGVDIPEVTTASKVLVNVTLRIDDHTIASNSWTLAVFPTSSGHAKKCPVPVFAEAGLLAAAQQVCSNAAAVPSSLGSQSSPFVLLRKGGLSEEDAAALARAGGFGVALNPDSGDWPVCGHSSVGSVGTTKVAFAQPWWMATGTTGTLVYETSLASNLGFAADDIFLDYGWMNVVNGGQAFTLDALDPSSDSTVHIRALPTDGAYGVGFETTISNDALVWEGKIAGAESEAGAGGRFLVSGLNLIDGAHLSSEPVAEFAFDALLTYVVDEAASARAAPPAERRQLHVNAADAKPCNVSGSFCPAGSETPCQLETVSPNVCNKGYEIITSVCLQEDAVLDALYPRLLARTSGSRMTGVVYDTSHDVANQSFCSAQVSSDPRRLVANGSIATLDSTEPAWFRVPMPQTPLKAGIYWIGVLLEADVTCYAETPPAGSGVAPVGPGSKDAYATRDFASGPGLGPELTWTHGSGGFAVYATTVAK